MSLGKKILENLKKKKFQWRKKIFIIFLKSMMKTKKFKRKKGVYGLAKIYF